MTEYTLNSREPHHRFRMSVTHPKSGMRYISYFSTLKSVMLSFQETPQQWRPSFDCLTPDALEEVQRWLATCVKSSA